MIVIADSSSTRTQWALTDGYTIVEQAETQGLNPFYKTRREISHSVRLELPEVFFRRRWEHVYFYGAGCATPGKNAIIEASLVAQFRTPVTIYSDLYGATRGLLGDEPGIACILGTGSNSCLYDGMNIVKNVPSLGFMLGDEGSGADIGRRFVGDCLRQLAPAELCNKFYAYLQMTPAQLMDAVYAPSPNRTLSSYTCFLAENEENQYVQRLVYNSFMRFFNCNIAAYDYKEYPLSFVGATACRFEPILRRVAADFGAEIRTVHKSSMPGLVRYHAKCNRK